jgi:hypothetical protein
MAADQASVARLNELRYLQEQEERIASIALERAGDMPFAEELERMRGQHERHRKELCRLLDEIGATAEDPSHEFMAFVQAQLRLVEEAGTPGELLERLLLTERGSAAMYAQADPGLPDFAAGSLDEQLEEELRHVTVVERLAPPPPDTRGDGGGPSIKRAGKVVTTPGTGVGHGPWTGPEGPIGQTDPDLIDEWPDR